MRAAVTAVVAVALAGCIRFGLDDRRFRCDGDPEICDDGEVCGADGYCIVAFTPDASIAIDAADGGAIGEVCGNMTDDDGDGDVDCADAECPSDPTCGIGCVCRGGDASEIACMDGLDNDTDHAADCLDTEDCPDVCQGATVCCADGACRVTC